MKLLLLNLFIVATSGVTTNIRRVLKKDGVCAVEGERSTDCGSSYTHAAQSCCEGLVCHDKHKWKCVKEENKSCAGPDTISHKCSPGTKYPLAPKECCEGLECIGGLCVEPSFGECAAENQPALNCGASGESGDVATMCCTGLKCHKTQTWRCVTAEKDTCAGEGTLARECGSVMHNGAGKCCEGLKCDYESHYCVDEDYKKVVVEKDEEDDGRCAVEGERSLDCGSSYPHASQSCCEGLVCHDKHTWKCVKEENKSCAGADTISHQCNPGTKYPLAPKECCEGLECIGDQCVEPSFGECAAKGQPAKNCGANSPKAATMCCAGLKCHATQNWRCVEADKYTCAGEGTLARECGSLMHNGAGKCCEGLKCDMETHYCVDEDYQKVA